MFGVGGRNIATGGLDPRRLSDIQRDFTPNLVAVTMTTATLPMRLHVPAAVITTQREIAVEAVSEPIVPALNPTVICSRVANRFAAVRELRFVMNAGASPTRRRGVLVHATAFPCPPIPVFFDAAIPVPPYDAVRQG